MWRQRTGGRRIVPACETTSDRGDRGCYAFEGIPETLGAGETTFVFANKGAVSHEMAIARLIGDKSIEEIAGQGDSGAIEEGSREVIPAIRPGASGELTLQLKPGRYGYVCFVGEGTNDEPHALYGMLGEFTVK